MRSRPALPLVALLLLPALGARAQTDSVDRLDLSRGLTLPPTTSALIEEATAPALNPGALIHVGGPQLLYLHERSIARNRVGDGLYLGAAFFKTVAAGLTVEWLRSNTGVDYRKTAWTFAAGSPVISVGATLNLFSARESADLDGLSTVSLGLSARPWRFLAFGASVQNVEGPRSGSVHLPREYRLGAATRPLGERYALGVDYVFGDGPGELAGRMTYVLQAEVLQGFLLGAGVSHGTRRGEPLQFQVSATFNTAHFGLTYALGGAPAGLDHVGMLRASVSPYRPIDLRHGKVALFDLDDLLTSSRSPALAVLGLGAQEDPLFRTLRLFEHATRDPALRGVVIKISRLPDVGLGKAAELREAILRLRASGKRVVAVLLSAEDPEYFVASAADRVLAVPQAFLAINGLSARATFLGEAMRKLGVHWDVARVGQYKSAPETLTRDDLSPPEREALTAFLDAQVRSYETQLARARSLEPAALRAALASGLTSPERAVAVGLVDEVVDPEALDDRLEKLVPGARFEPGYAPRVERPVPWGTPRKIAIVPVLGSISGGKSREDPLGIQRIAGAETIIAALEQAASDDGIDGIVLRIDSGGGDGLASDLIYRAVLRAKKKKPVVASLGDMAASGGYYVAMGAQEIWASPTTLTGSIGVFVLKPALEELAGKLGVHQELLLRGPQADVFGFFRRWTPEEQKVAQQWVDDFYGRFIQEVAQSRGLPRARVHDVAQGRIWSGEDALRHHLVDGLGGWADAIAAVKKGAAIREGERLEWVVLGEARPFLSSLAGEIGVSVEVPSLAPSLPVGEVLRTLGLPGWVLQAPGIQARLPMALEVR